MAIEKKYHPIPLDTLKIKDIKTYDIYIKHKSVEVYVLFLKAGLEFTEEKRKTLIDNNVEFLYVNNEGIKTYYEEQNNLLKELVKNEYVPLEKKASLLYHNSKQLMKFVFLDPTHTNLKIAEENIKTAVDFILTNPLALHYLIDITEHDYYTYTHSVNVGIYSVALANVVFGKTTNVNFYNLGAGFFFHDLGKSKIPLEILNKQGKLDDREWAIMKQHPKLSYEILKDNNYLFKEAAYIAMQHHEKFNGKGYPQGLKGNEISLYGQICSIADVFDALTTKRSYKNAMTTFEALTLMKNEMLDSFNPQLFEKFVKLFMTKK